MSSNNLIFHKCLPEVLGSKYRNLEAKVKQIQLFSINTINKDYFSINLYICNKFTPKVNIYKIKMYSKRKYFWNSNVLQQPNLLIFDTLLTNLNLNSISYSLY